MDVTKASPGALLIAIHNFAARSNDELSLNKGDIIELVERDDEFGDGWYSGRHVTSSRNGLFPAIYTAVKEEPAPPARSNSISRSNSLNRANSINRPATREAVQRMSLEEKDGGGVGLRQMDITPQASPASSLHQTATSPLSKDMPTAPSHLNIVRTKSLPRPPSTGPTTPQKDQNGDEGLETTKSPVMTETLSVIQEHITDLNTTNNLHKYTRADSFDIDDSNSGSHPSHRDSYIAGSETDEEDGPEITETEVLEWTPSQVALYLHDVGVERAHCEIFEDQEISGEVLLGMEQSSLFLREFELGSVGRRLRTWQKIKAFQDAVKRPMTPRPSQGSGRHSAMGSRLEHRRLTSASASTSNLGKTPSMRESEVSTPHTSLNEVHPPSQTNDSRTDSIKSEPEVQALKRLSVPEPADKAQTNHRRYSSIEANKTPIVTNLADGGVSVSPAKAPEASYTVKSPFENVAKSSSSSPKIGSITRSSFFGHRLSSSIDQAVHNRNMRDSGYTTATKDVDRGYFSSTEVEKARNVLRKASHFRKGSYSDRRNASHTRVVSLDSATGDNIYGTVMSSPTTSHASFDLKGNPLSPLEAANTVALSPQADKFKHNRHTSDGTVNLVSPTKVRASDDGPPSMLNPIALRSQKTRSISQAVTGRERSIVISSPVSVDSPDSLNAPRSESNPTPNKSFESDSTDAKRDISGKMPSASARRKGKKHTSAYMKGLEKKSPIEQIADSDCSGWMKKKNTRLMTTWKPRLFVLRGRRLSYYYSEDDQEERGLIDISGHRVLPANNERLTGLHASLTGAAPVVPPKSPPQGGLAQPEEEIFIFKLVPPRAGMSKAVNFTKPTIHYFAVESLADGRRWMAALMKATIDRDESGKVITSYALKTISLAKARQMRQRPPALQDSDEDEKPPSAKDSNSISKESATKQTTTTTEGALNGISIDTTSLEEAFQMDTTPVLEYPSLQIAKVAAD